jgi:hypothetical protein
LVCRQKGTDRPWSGDRSQTTLWNIDKPLKSETGHSTQKPVECMLRPIENNNKPGEAVYSPFEGSGTTIIAAEMTGRKCLAIEINPAYVDVCIERYIAYSGEKATLDGRTFAEVRDARHNDNGHLAGSVQGGPNAVEDKGAHVTGAAEDAHSRGADSEIAEQGDEGVDGPPLQAGSG